MPGFRDRFSRTDFFTLTGDESSQVQFSRGLGRFATGFAIDAIGDSGRPGNYQPVESAWYVPGPTALIDVYTPAPNTTGALVVDDPDHVIAACDTPGDNDWFAVTLTAGVTYQFGQYAYVGGIPGAEGNGVALADAYLEIYDSAGNLLSIADGGGPNTPSGLDALMTFEATYSGTYYVNATSYDNTGDGVGDFAGDYEIFARTATGTTYTTHYDISSPLHSIDWGGVLVNREHVSVRNPDGEEGPRITGEPAADPADVVGNTLGFPGKNVIYLYFGGEGDLYANADSTIPAQVTVQNPYQYEIQAMLTAANEFSKVADVVFVSNYTFNASTGLYERNENIEYKPGPLGPEAGVQYATGVDGDGFDADFFYFSYPGTPGPGISLLGSMSPPDYGDEGVAQFNSADERWNAQMLQQGGFSFVTLIHEFGHGMGLAHPHDTGGGSSVMHGVQTNGVPGDDGGAGDFDLNQGVHTMMSYNDGWEKSPYGQAETNNEGYGWLGSLMAFDIAVIQDKYGVNEDWATGNDSYVLKDVNEWGVYIDAATGQPAVHDATNQATARDGYYVGQSTYYSSIWDAGGVDQIIYAGARNTTIDLRAATLQYEYGGAGWMSYATGIYGGYTIANGVTIENAFTGAGADTLIGNAVANLLDGGAGIDTMTGGLGDDTYYVDNAGDLVNESVGQGTDRIASTVTYVLANGIEVEKLEVKDTTDTNAVDLQANDFAQTIIGSAGVNILRGQGGNDQLIAFAGNDFLVGGTGADIMYGGIGNDTYYVDDLGDRAFESASEGTDRIAASISYTLDDASEVELLEAVNTLDANAMDLTGSNSANLIIGNAGVNLLFGLNGNDTLVGLAGDDSLVGGTGADIMYGGTGNDAYYVDDLGDRAYEAAGEGTDRISTVISYTLDDASEIELLESTNTLDTNAMDLTGSSSANTIIGNAGVNMLYGGGGNDTLVALGGNDYLIGGTGADAMSGGLGDDTYYVDDVGDQINEFASQGTDRVATSVSYTLTHDLETLEAVNTADTSAINLTGNAAANTITGNAGANVIDGKGGQDTLVGLGGADFFAFTTALGGGNVDTIGDFQAGTDKIQLDDAVFTGLGFGALAASAFHVGATATDEDQRIIYDSATGNLYYDVDGNGSEAMVQFATLNSGLSLTAGDFTVI